MITGKKTKIVATIGPASEDKETLTKLVNAGLNVIRLNFSHGSHEEHSKRIKNTREIAQELNTPLAILQDLAGPKIRIGDFSTETVTLEKGANFILTAEECIGTKEKVSLNYENLHNDVKVNSKIFLNDGKIKLVVKEISGNEVHCTVLEGGEIKGRRGVNLPGAYLKISCLTNKDKKDVQFGIKQEVDFMALSFVRKASDVEELKAILKKSKADIKIIAKIETQEALENLDEIIKSADGIMVARGDLAVEVPAEEVPIWQKKIIKKCNEAGKPVITATQMLVSMISISTPTRAEINDVANAILDGTDAVMLSEETTIGKFPELAVKTMTSVALHVEKHFPYEEVLKDHHLMSKDVTGSVGYSVVNTAHDIDAEAIIALTLSGFTARMIARYKPKRPILVLTTDKKTYNRLALSFNCYPILTEQFDGVSRTIEITKEKVIQHSLAKHDDTVVIAAGIPFSQAGNTNFMLVQKI